MQDDKKQEPSMYKEAFVQAIKAFSFLGGLGFYFAAVMGICVFAGHWADEHFGLGHYGKLAGIIIGFPIAIYTLYRQIKRAR